MSLKLATLRVAYFLLSGVPALWNVEPIPLGSAESKKKINLCALCGSSEAGVEYPMQIECKEIRHK